MTEEKSPHVGPLYKIRNRKTGLFSKGGRSPLWGPEGKTWVSKRALRAHFALLPFGYNTRDWEILLYPVEYPHKMTVKTFLEG